MNLAAFHLPQADNAIVVSHDSRIETRESQVVTALKERMDRKKAKRFLAFAGGLPLQNNLYELGYLSYLLLAEKHSNHADAMYDSLFDPSSKVTSASLLKFETEEERLEAEQEFLTKYVPFTI